MTTLVIAAAQSISIPGEMQSNLARHRRLMEVAADHGVQFLVFPELSLTGYAIAMARKLAIRIEDERLNALHEQAQRSGMITLVGAPVLSDTNDQVLIGAIVLGNDGAPSVYRKQHLHAGEEAVFTAGEDAATVVIGHTRAALAICADILHPKHAAQAASVKAGIYAASVLITENAYAKETELLRTYAIEHQMVVLMANHGGPSGGWQPVGRSACWAADGGIVAAAPGEGNLLLIAAQDAGQWSGQVVKVEI